jgi:hypothetical protein
VTIVFTACEFTYPSQFVPTAYKILHIVHEYRSKPEFVQLFSVNASVRFEELRLFSFFIPSCPST